MKNIQSIVLGIMGLAIAILYFLHFKSNTPKVNLHPNAKETSTAMLGNKVVFVNIDSFFAKYEGYKKLKADLESAEKSAQKQSESKNKALQMDYQKLVQQAQSGQITPQQAQAKEAEMMKRMESLKKEEEQLLKNLSNKTNKATEDLYKKVDAYFQNNQSKYNCDYVMGYQTNGMLLYFDKSMDITNELVEDLNKEK